EEILVAWMTPRRFSPRVAGRVGRDDGMIAGSRVQAASSSRKGLLPMMTLESHHLAAIAETHTTEASQPGTWSSWRANPLGASIAPARAGVTSRTAPGLRQADHSPVTFTGPERRCVVDTSGEASQRRAVRSILLEMRRWPSGLKATQFTPAVWPRKVKTSSP